jgi:PP-loop superfamily ATP-utilizing enzyme
MHKKITIMSEEFENEQTGDKVEGVTIIIDGILKQFLEVIKAKAKGYETNLSVIQDALMKGLEIVKNEVDE